MELKRHLYPYQGQDVLPNQSWHKYFSLSEIGKEYDVLYEVENGGFGKLVMSNTEYELKTNTPLYDEVKKRGPGVNILSIGYGIGFIVEKMAELGANLTVVEKYQEVMDLNPDAPNNVRVIVSDINTVDLKSNFEAKEFDIIFMDITNCEEFQRERDLRTHLKDDGRFMKWAHMR